MRKYLLYYAFIEYRVLFQICFGKSFVNAQTTVERPKRYSSQVEPTCVVYDETQAGRALLDDLSGSPCSLYLTSHFQTPREGYSITTKLITTGNPLAQYLVIHTRNYTLLTLKRIDREQICEQFVNEVANMGSGMHRCCAGRKRDCDIPLTILIQTKRLGNDTVHDRQSSQFVRLQLRLIDINDNAPRFPSARYQSFVSEAVKVGTRIQLPLAQDADSDEYGIIRYDLQSQETDTFELVQISLLNSQPNDSLLSMLDMSNQEKYSLSRNTAYFEDTDALNSAPIHVYLKLLKPLDWETKRLYKVVLIAEDNGAPPLTGQLAVEIIVTDENDNHPVFPNKTFTLSVPENSPKGKRLLQLVAHDPDEGKGGVVVYSLAESISDRLTKPYKIYHPSMGDNQHIFGNQNTSNSPFQIDPQTGWLSLDGKLDYERVGQYFIRVIARDNAGHPGFDEATVNLIVVDVNDVAPVISVEPIVDLNEPSARSGQVKSSVPQTLDLHVREITNPNIVSVNRPSQLSIGNYETTALLALVAVRDPDTGKGGQFQCGLQPIRRASSATGPNDVLTFVAKEGRNEFYRIPLPESNLKSSSVVSGPFRLNPISKTQFELNAVGGFDHERQALEQVTIFCSDFGEPSLSSTFTINVHVEDVNDNVPQFVQSPYQLSIEENRPIDTVVQKLTATDNDSGINAEIEYFLDPTGMEFFRIDPVDGTLYTRVVFDREVRASYRFHVFAKDKGEPEPLTGTATIELSVLDVNDNAPEFVGLDHDNCYRFRIAENEPADTHIGILLGSDIDAQENARLRFRLVTTTSLFKLDPSTGELTSAHALDRERQAEHELIVILSDRGRPPRSVTATVVIHVTDVNDNEPIIVFPANGRGNVTVSFREPPGEVVARIEARDPDEGHNALLHYGLVNGNRNAVFRMGSTSAELIIDRELDETDIGIYVLDILIQDAGLPPKSSQVQMVVQVTDSPARMYSHRFSSGHLKHPETDITYSGTSSGLPRRSDLIANKHQDTRESRGSESYQSEPSIVSAGAILVAIVALSCAIILVLLGLTVYLCGRRGIRLRRICSFNRNRLNRNPTGWTLGQTDELDATEKSSAGLVQTNHSNSRTNTYTDQIMIDPGTGTVLRYPLVTVSPSSAGMRDVDYAEQNMIHRPSAFTCDGYTTCIPLRDRVVSTGQYDSFTGPRFCPASINDHIHEQRKHPAINNAIVVDHAYASKTISPKRFKAIQEQFTDAQAKRSCQSLKTRKIEGSKASDMCASDGSPDEHTRAGSFPKRMRTVRSCDSILTLGEYEQTTRLAIVGSNTCQIVSPDQIVQDRTDGDLLKGLPTQDCKLRCTPHPTSLPMSTFLPKSRQTTVPHCFPHSPLPTGQQANRIHTSFAHNATAPETFNYTGEDKQDYSCLLHHPNTTAIIPRFMRLQQSCPSCLEPICDLKSTKTDETCEVETENLIDLIDSSTNSNSSQPCSCTVGNLERTNPVHKGNLWITGDQTEFV